ncbi:MAG: type IV secretion system protein [Martelella sp.]|uniref:virB8 family protein n=1 Tax=Martelella sp. TaxID=1969699 RepID=UPI003242F1AA
MSNTGFEADLILQPRRSERRAWMVAGAASGIAVLLAFCIFFMMPLRTTEVFTVLVDKTTGEAEKIIQVQPTNIDDQRAIKESLLVSYVTDRESFYPAGIQERLEAVLRMSKGQAADTLRTLWTNTAENEDYPPRVYGAGSEVSVKVRAINFLRDDVAQVRFEKTLRKPRQAPITRQFIATIGFEFDPRTERQLERVWENPLGFVVTNYNVDAETLEK